MVIQKQLIGHNGSVRCSVYLLVWSLFLLQGRPRSYPDKRAPYSTVTHFDIIPLSYLRYDVRSVNSFFWTVEADAWYRRSDILSHSKRNVEITSINPNRFFLPKVPIDVSFGDVGYVKMMSSWNLIICVILSLITKEKPTRAVMTIWLHQGQLYQRTSATVSSG